MCIDLEEVERRMRALRSSCAEVSATAACGVYAWFVKTPRALTPFPVPADGLIYIGSSGNLAEREFRQHLSDTASSSLRRSLGAILKPKLGAAVPRSSSLSDRRRFTHYRFSPGSEKWLTKWMHRNLDLAIVECEDHLRVEAALISRLHPLLCLKGWDNPDRAAIKALRRSCASEARAYLAV